MCFDLSHLVEHPVFFPCYIKLDNFLIEKVGQTELISIEPNKEQFMTRPHAC
jgi:hypothetical protein